MRYDLESMTPVRATRWVGLLGPIATLAIACGGAPGTHPARSARPPVEGRAADPFAPGSMMADVEWLCAPARRGRGTGTPDAAAAADYVAGELAAAGLEVMRQKVVGASDNVIGILRGDDRAVLVAAHHDHLGVDGWGRVYPGADDDASGVAVMLALARDAARHRFTHTILFISFAAEEEGLLGSAAYIARPVWPLDRTLAMINFDMVGRRFFESGVDRPATVAVIGLEDHTGAREVVERVARSVGLDPIPAPARLVEVFGFGARTDDWRFRREGVVAIHFSTGFHDDYHRPTDTPERLVPGQMARVARTAAGLLRYLGK